MQTDDARRKMEKQSAFDLGQSTLDLINRIVITSQHETSERVQQARDNIARSERFLHLLMVVGPLIIILTTFYFFRNFTVSVLTLANATRKVKGGDLSF